MKIDVTKIEGFEDLTAEEKLAKVLAYEFEEPKTDNVEINRLKTALSKANSEAAEYKRQWKDKQTEAERAETERIEAEKALKDELASLRREKTVSEYEKRCLEIGYDSALATECASAMADGRINDVFAIQKRFMENKTREIETAALNKAPSLSAGSPPVQAAEKAEENRMRGYFGLPPI